MENCYPSPPLPANLPEEGIICPLYQSSIYYVFCWFYKKEPIWMLRFHFRIKIWNMMRFPLCCICPYLRVFRLWIIQIWQLQSILKIVVNISLFMSHIPDFLKNSNHYNGGSMWTWVVPRYIEPYHLQVC